LVCVKICIRDIETPVESDVLAIIRMPTNQPLLVIADARLNGEDLVKMRPLTWKLYQRRGGVTRTILARKIVV
jgi:hypothetical protein